MWLREKRVMLIPIWHVKDILEKHGMYMAEETRRALTSIAEIVERVSRIQVDGAKSELNRLGVYIRAGIPSDFTLLTWLQRQLERQGVDVRTEYDQRRPFDPPEKLRADLVVMHSWLYEKYKHECIPAALMVFPVHTYYAPLVWLRGSCMKDTIHIYGEESVTGQVFEKIYRSYARGILSENGINLETVRVATGAEVYREYGKVLDMGLNPIVQHVTPTNELTAYIASLRCYLDLARSERRIPIRVFIDVRLVTDVICVSEDAWPALHAIFAEQCRDGCELSLVDVDAGRIEEYIHIFSELEPVKSIARHASKILAERLRTTSELRGEIRVKQFRPVIVNRFDGVDYMVF